MSGISAARHHADWLSLVEVSGPFVSMPVLLKVFPQGLEPRDPAQAKALRAAYEEWQDNPAGPGLQRAWLLHVLTALLGYPADRIAEGQSLPAGLEANMPEMGERLRPNFALVGPKGTDTSGQAQLLITTYPAEQALDRPVIGKHWKANPSTRMMELLHASGVVLGLVTNGEQWMLVYAPRGETTGYASWYSTIWLDEPITLRAFHSLLGVRRFFGVAADNTLLGLLKESAQDQQEVTNQLGYQVREAVEVLVQAFDVLDQDSNRTLLKGVSESTLYEAALTVMMRLVFLFSAEERGLLHLGKPVYDDNYAVSTLLEQLQEVADLHGPQVLERRFDAWARLLATFRAVHAGVHHQDLLMPAYGGSLFDPDRYPFLEGRSVGSDWATTRAEPLAINNRVALHLLTSLQKLRIRVPGGSSESRRVSFRALGVEQIGHVYEGLLDHTAVRATEPVLGIKGTRDKESEIFLTTLESTLTQGRDNLIDFLKEASSRSVSALKRAIEEESPFDEHRLLIACGHDTGLLQRVRPFAGLIREDSFERPVIILPGSVYVTAGTARRSTGTHYTPPSLTEPIVQYTLEPLVYHGPAEGLPRDQWLLKTPKEILDLKVCDMAMGSGAFLVQVCRYLAERLVETWENEETKHPGEVLTTPEGGFSKGVSSERLVPQDSGERLAIARRIVADRCLYGVDINHMAVEMAKLSIWLVTLDAKRPFTFLDHAFKRGDSLIGITSFDQLENFTLRPGGSKQLAFGTMNLRRHIEEAKKKRELLEAMPSDTPEQLESKMALYVEAEDAVAKLNVAADVLSAVELKDLNARAYEIEREVSADQMMALWANGLQELQAFGRKCLAGQQRFHWPLAFPEIMERGGFDAVVGNPPFMGGLKLETAFGKQWRAFVVTHIAGGIRGTRGTADLSAYFLLRASRLLRPGGNIGYITTNTISQGDSREIGLDQLLRAGFSIFRAIPSSQWPGEATIEIAHLWITRRQWAGHLFINASVVTNISSSLNAQSGVASQGPHELIENADKAFQGALVVGMGFILEPQEAESLRQANSINRDVLLQYLNGEDINSSPSQLPSRWVINFFGFPLDRQTAPAGYRGPVAEDYPECLSIVRERVLPERSRYEPKNPWNRKLRSEWWLFGQWRWALYEAIAPLNRVLVRSRVANINSIAFAPTSYVFSDAVVVFAFDDMGHFALLQSFAHTVQLEQYSSSMRTDVRYTPSSCFSTFSRPEVSSLEGVGQLYYEMRQRLMLSRQEGLTRTYTHFHNLQDRTGDIEQLRKLHVEMDYAVAAAYGWNDLDLAHGFHKTKQGPRYTISEVARREVLDRLLALNHQRHAEEEAARNTIAAKSKPVTKRGRKKQPNQIPPEDDLFNVQRGQV